ncbi:MAG: hypothetical protein AAGA55_08970 [Planctomycetota bacterium]
MRLRAGHTNADRFTGWGDSLMNKLPSRSRKRRKRDASKRRRLFLRREAAESRR